MKLSPDGVLVLLNATLKSDDEYTIWSVWLHKPSYPMPEWARKPAKIRLSHKSKLEVLNYNRWFLPDAYGNTLVDCLAVDGHPIPMRRTDLQFFTTYWEAWAALLPYKGDFR